MAFEWQKPVDTRLTHHHRIRYLLNHHDEDRAAKLVGLAMAEYVRLCAALIVEQK